MSEDPHPNMPHTQPGADETQVQRGPAVRAGQPVIAPESAWLILFKHFRRVLRWWLPETGISSALALSPLLVLGIISWVPAVGHSAALRAVPLVALVLYLPWIFWDIRRAASGRPPIDPFLRHMVMRVPHQVEKYHGRMIVQLIVALFCLPALTVLALRATVLSFLTVGLTVLPMLGYAISVGVGGLFLALSVVGSIVLPPEPDRISSGDESDPNRP